MQTIKILVVDDFGPFRKLVCSRLQQTNGLQISEASNGLEAVQKVQELVPDLILLDIGLPDLNGIEVARRVRKLCPLAKILFLSQETSADIVEVALNTGAQGYVHKSHAASELRLAVETVRRGRTFVSNGLQPVSSADVAALADGVRGARTEFELAADGRRSTMRLFRDVEGNDDCRKALKRAGLRHQEALQKYKEAVNVYSAAILKDRILPKS
jgi:DNA-binding response OmpR family regulator